MNEVDALPKPQDQLPEAILSDKITAAIVEEQIETLTQLEEKNNNAEESSQSGKLESKPSQPVSTQTQPQAECLKIVVEESLEEKPLTSPPRKSARLSAKRRDSATDSDVSSTAMRDSPILRRRSLRRNSISLQDSTPSKAKDEPASKALPTIIEIDKTDTGSDHTSSIIRNESEQSEKALIDELAAAFVEEFIDNE